MTRCGRWGGRPSEVRSIHLWIDAFGKLEIAFLAQLGDRALEFAGSNFRALVAVAVALRQHSALFSP
ncbi:MULTISPECIES: hypothetical protein [unclassified Bradyrhizobium]|uniref:hypothetical protein n=1 Tax=unclassified Bradyrhizobium TaxID=2631580 RepID=UPI002916C16E|nr:MULTISPECIES: hypothetical protein [unclassified Bradyrhizobium]